MANNSVPTIPQRDPWPPDLSGRPRPGDTAALRQFTGVDSMCAATGCPAFFDMPCCGVECGFFRLDDSHGARGQVVSRIAACTWPRGRTRRGIGWIKTNPRLLESAKAVTRA
jgi:hypothetical protein